MFFRIRSIVICLCVIVLPQTSLAVENDDVWQQWILRQVQLHPKLIAARAEMDSALARAEAGEQPLYNPEFEAEYERNDGFDNYRVGISQTIDMWNKRDVRKQQGTYQRILALSRYQQVLQDKLAEALKSLVDYQSSKEVADFARKQEQQLDTLLALVQKRSDAGDMGQIDTELAFFNLSQRLGTTAEAQATFKRMASSLDEILPEWSEEKAEIPLFFWQVSNESLIDDDLRKLPAVVAARAQYEIAEQKANFARLEAKTEPTLSVNGGEDGGNGVVSVALSIPLNVRNSYHAKVKAIRLEVNSAKSTFLSIKRQKKFACQAALATLFEYRSYYQRWQKLIQGRSASSEELLQKQWDSGDLSTVDYLLALDQRAEGMIAGIELRRQYQLASIEWLYLSGQLIQNNNEKE